VVLAEVAMLSMQLIPTEFSTKVSEIIQPPNACAINVASINVASKEGAQSRWYMKAGDA
jgi:hypothetical protein